MSKSIRFRQSLVTTVIAGGVLCACAWRADASTYFQTNLVSDVPGLAIVTDSSFLINPWGLVSSAAGSPFWSSNQGTNTSTLYAVTGSTNVSKVNVAPNGFVAIPQTGAGPQGPTGIVSNANTAAFQLVPGTPSTSARFIFANLNGTISGWAGGASATIQATTPGAVYTGLAINSATAGTRLYAANGATGGIDVFGSNFAPLSLPGAFTDPTLPAGFVPFNVQNLNGQIYVTYAPSGLAAQRGATPGQGFVSVFDENGVFLRRVITGGPLAAPWGLALAPASFGQFGGDLLVGNFSFVASGINAFDPDTGVFEGTIPIDVGSDHTPGGLWALMFGHGANGGDPNTLYFTDGIDGETHGLFGAIAETPLPAALPLFASGLGALGLLAWRKKKKVATTTV